MPPITAPIPIFCEETTFRNNVCMISLPTRTLQDVDGAVCFTDETTPPPLTYDNTTMTFEKCGSQSFSLLQQTLVNGDQQRLLIWIEPNRVWPQTATVTIDATNVSVEINR